MMYLSREQFGLQGDQLENNSNKTVVKIIEHMILVNLIAYKCMILKIKNATAKAIIN